MEQPYHKYVFDKEKRAFVGKFEEMYQNEEIVGYDSWLQEDLIQIDKQISALVLDRCEFGKILDVGCGKGAFTHLLKKNGNYVLGVDVSETAIAKAKAKYPDVEFRCVSVDGLRSLPESPFDLVVAMEVLSYLEDWREVLASISGITRYLYLTLFVPPDPIGFVKSFEGLLAEVHKYFQVEMEIVLDKHKILLMARVLE